MGAILIESVGIIISGGITLLLLSYEFRKSRELEVYYQTYEKLVWAIPKIEHLCNSLFPLFWELSVTNEQLMKNNKFDYTIIRPLGDDVNCLYFYEQTLRDANTIIDNIKALTRELYYLSLNFKESSESRKLLVGIQNATEEFIKKNYSHTLESLDFVRETKFIDPEEFVDIFQSREVEKEGKVYKEYELTYVPFKVQNQENIMKHFNKNDFD
ncbi:hypothetical protein P1O00_07540 [Erysipelothrix rhusiopathiae]|nr:hypothetical protein [Erysipelothrix rhusiopathiae]MDE9419827.1 hypothetical protein [Erysipelothrix rhusiopathiae]